MDQDTNRLKSIYHGCSKWVHAPTCSPGRQIKNILSVLQTRSSSAVETFTSFLSDVKNNRYSYFQNITNTRFLSPDGEASETTRKRDYINTGIVGMHVEHVEVKDGSIHARMKILRRQKIKPDGSVCDYQSAETGLSATALLPFDPFHLKYLAEITVKQSKLIKSLCETFNFNTIIVSFAPEMHLHLMKSNTMDQDTSSRKWTDSSAARSSEGKNHDTETSPITSELPIKGLQSRKWTDSAAARSSEGKNHETEISPITSEFPIKGLQSRKWTDSSAARSSEGKNHDTEISPITSELLFKSLQSRKWTDSAAARSSEGKNHDTELIYIRSELLDSMDRIHPLLMDLLTFVLFGIFQIIFPACVGYLVLFFIISKSHIIKIKRQEPDAAVLNEMKSTMSSLDKKLRQLASKTSADIDSLRAQVEILQKKPMQNIFTQGSKQVNFIVDGVEVEGLSDKMTTSPGAQSVLEALHGVSDQLFLNKLRNEFFGIGNEYENLPVLTRRNTSTTDN